MSSDPQAPQPQRQAARQLQIWLKHTVLSSGQSMIAFEKEHEQTQNQKRHDEDGDNAVDKAPYPAVATIDEALGSLNGGEDALRDDSLLASYIPTVEYDWILDGRDEGDDVRASRALTHELDHSDNDWLDKLEQLVQERGPDLLEYYREYHERHSRPTIVELPPVGKPNAEQNTTNLQIPSLSKGGGDGNRIQNTREGSDFAVQFSSFDSEDEFGEFQEARLPESDAGAQQDETMGEDGSDEGENSTMVAIQDGCGECENSLEGSSKDAENEDSTEFGDFQAPPLTDLDVGAPDESTTVTLYHDCISRTPASSFGTALTSQVSFPRTPRTPSVRLSPGEHKNDENIRGFGMPDPTTPIITNANRCQRTSPESSSEKGKKKPKAELTPCSRIRMPNYVLDEESQAEDIIASDEDDEEASHIDDEDDGTDDASIPSVVRFSSKSGSQEGDHPEIFTPIATKLLSPLHMWSPSVPLTPGYISDSHSWRKSIEDDASLGDGESYMEYDDEPSILSRESITSPLGRFLRRNSQIGEEDERDSEALKGVPEQYLSNLHLDDTVDVLKTIDWEFIPFWQLPRLLSPIPNSDRHEDRLGVVHETITQRLSELDGAHARVHRHLLQVLRPHAARLDQANETVHELQRHLRVAQFHASKSRKAIEHVRQEGVDQQLSLLDAWDQQSDYQRLQDVLQEANEAIAKDLQLQNQITSFVPSQAHPGAAAALLEHRQLSNLVSRLECLRNVRERANCMPHALWNRLFDLVKQATIGACGQFAVDKYEALVGSIVHLYHERNGEGLFLEDQESQNPLAKRWANAVEEALREEIDRAFCLALLDPTADPSNDSSEYDAELLEWNYELRQRRCNVRSMTQNLLTIRFDFEVDRHHLGAVYHRLCHLLVDVLHGHTEVVSWHKTKMNVDPLQQTLVELQKRKEYIWERCVDVLARCVEEHRRVQSKRVLFESDSNGELDDSHWLVDLQGLHDVSRLSDQFLSLKEEFLDQSASESTPSESEMYLNELMQDLMSKHLRTVHIEAMNSTGISLSKEDWQLVPLKPRCTGVRGLDSVLMQLLAEKRDEADTDDRAIGSRSWTNRFVIPRTKGRHLASFGSAGNPFQIIDPSKDMAKRKTLRCFPSQSELEGDELRCLLRAYCSSHDPCFSKVVPKCLPNVVFRWTSRLLLIIQRLPLIAGKACKVIENLYDLYITTVFRLCAGSADFENLLLGSQEPPRISLVESSAASQTTTSPLFGFRRSRSTVNSRLVRPTPVLTSDLDAELCAPLPKERDNLDLLRDTIQTAQQRLQGIVKLDLVDQWISDPPPNPADSRAVYACKAARVLEQRQAASWSCLFLAASLQIAAQVAAKESLDGELDEYASNLFKAVPLLVPACNRISCARALRAKSIVQSIIAVGPGWEESKLHEHPNLYVDSLSDLCALLWCSLSNANRLPLGALKDLWENLIWIGYVALLDGFSRVPRCSTEGRALMSMDLASFEGSIRPSSVMERLEKQSRCQTPPIASVRGKTYVDTYIKVFYYPRSDVVSWVEANYRQYQYNHCLALIVESEPSAADRDANGNGDMSKLVKQLDALYNYDQEE